MKATTGVAFVFFVQALPKINYLDFLTIKNILVKFLYFQYGLNRQINAHPVSYWASQQLSNSLFIATSQAGRWL
jgi:hypothetical protein